MYFLTKIGVANQVGLQPWKFFWKKNFREKLIIQKKFVPNFSVSFLFFNLRHFLLGLKRIWWRLFCARIKVSKMQTRAWLRFRHSTCTLSVRCTKSTKSVKHFLYFICASYWQSAFGAQGSGIFLPKSAKSTLFWLKKCCFLPNWGG